MTKEEAIKILTGYMGGKIAPESTELYQAIELVVDILESQPSLPSNLDEAAEEYRDTEMCTDSDYIDDDGDSLYRSFALREAFKAGAEWMAGQGITVGGTFHHSCGYPSVIELKTYLRDYEGADVIVQIRKK